MPIAYDVAFSFLNIFQIFKFFKPIRFFIPPAGVLATDYPVGPPPDFFLFIDIFLLMWGPENDTVYLACAKSGE